MNKDYLKNVGDDDKFDPYINGYHPSSHSYIGDLDDLDNLDYFDKVQADEYKFPSYEVEKHVFLKDPNPDQAANLLSKKSSGRPGLELKNFSHKLSSALIGKYLKLKQYFTLVDEIAKSCGVTLNIRSDNYLEIKTNAKESGTIESFIDLFKDMEQQWEKDSVTTKITCNKEEFEHITKNLKVFGKEEVIEKTELNFFDIDSEQNNKKPLILKEYIINQSYQLSLVRVDNPLAWEFDGLNDYLVLNMEESSGLYMEKLGYTLAMDMKALRKSIKEKRRQGSLKRGLNEVIANNQKGRRLPILLNIITNKDIEARTELEIINELRDRVFQYLNKEKKYANIYLALPKKNEEIFLKQIIKKFQQEAKVSAERNEQNFCEFPSKFLFIVDEKQSAQSVSLLERFCKNQSLVQNFNDNLDQEAGFWSVHWYNPSTRQNVHSKFPREINRVIEKAYLMGKMKIEVALPPNFEAEFSNSSGLINKRPTKRSKNKSPAQQKEMDIETGNDCIELDFKRLTETSKITSWTKILTKDQLPSGDYRYHYYEEKGGNIKAYPDHLMKVMQLHDELDNTMTLSKSFDDEKILNVVYEIDMNTNQMRKLGNGANPNPAMAGLPAGIFGGAYRGPSVFTGVSMSLGQFPVFALKRTQSKKYNHLINEVKALKKKNNDDDLRIDEVNSGFEKSEERKIPNLIISGMKEDVAELEDVIRHLKKKHLVEITCPIENDSECFKKFMDDLAMKNNIAYKIIKMEIKPVDSVNLKKEHKFCVKLSGNKKTLNRLLEEIQTVSSIEDEGEKYPAHWEPQTEDFHEHVLDGQSEEFKTASELMLKTWKANIVKITRIQNKNLWNNYMFEKKKMTKKGNNKERLLFHGTRQTDPAIIYKGKDDGFDMRLAAHGSYGRGIYFAGDASYSCSGYFHPKPNGNNLVLLAQVLVGNFHEGQSGSNITCPPHLPNSKTERYDSIKAVGADIFIVYNNNKAYPAYLIEYNLSGSGNPRALIGGVAPAPGIFGGGFPGVGFGLAPANPIIQPYADDDDDDSYEYE